MAALQGLELCLRLFRPVQQCLVGVEGHSSIAPLLPSQICNMKRWGPWRVKVQLATCPSLGWSDAGPLDQVPVRLCPACPQGVLDRHSLSTALHSWPRAAGPVPQWTRLGATCLVILPPFHSINSFPQSGEGRWAEYFKECRSSWHQGHLQHLKCSGTSEHQGSMWMNLKDVGMC